jgi:hypothetical protein
VKGSLSKFNPSPHFRLCRHAIRGIPGSGQMFPDYIHVACEIHALNLFFLSVLFLIKYLAHAVVFLYNL